MNLIAIGEFRRLTKSQMLELAPVQISFDGEVLGVFSKAEEVIVIGDMHPRVQNQFKGREQLVRAGMPKPERIRLDEPIKEADAED